MSGLNCFSSRKRPKSKASDFEDSQENAIVKDTEEPVTKDNLASGIELLSDTGQGQSPRYRPNVPSELASLIQSYQLPHDTKVAVIALAGVDCPEQTCFTLLLLRYLEYRSTIKDGVAKRTRDGFISFLSKKSPTIVQSFQGLVNRPGLRMWPRIFQIASDVVIFVVCAVGALASDIMISGASPLLSMSVLCSSIQLVHLNSKVGDVCVRDCMHTIMTSTDFLLYSNGLLPTKAFSRLFFLTGNASAVSATKGASGSKDSMLARADVAIRQTQVDQFKKQAFPSGRYEEVDCPSIRINVVKKVLTNFQAGRVPKSYSSEVFEFCERVLGKGDAELPLKTGFRGQNVKLGDFSSFVDQVCNVSVLSESIPEWNRQAVLAYAGKLCDLQVSNRKHFDERDKEAQTSAFSTQERLKYMWEFHLDNPKEWMRLIGRFDKLIKLWDTFDSRIQCSTPEQRVRLLADMDQVLVEIRDVSVPDKNIVCQWVRWDCLIRGGCDTCVRKSVAMVMDRITNGDITSTAQYIETRNDLLDVTKLLGNCLGLCSPKLSLLPQYRDLELGLVGDISWCVVYMTDAVWSERGQGSFSDIHSCTRNAEQEFCSEFTSIVSELGDGDWNWANMSKQLDDLSGRVLSKFDKGVGKHRKVVSAACRNEFDLIACDQRSTLTDRIQVGINDCRTFMTADLTGKCLNPQLDKMMSISWVVRFYLRTADCSTWCLRHVVAELMLKRV